jgi:formylglycine-generating enzyme required for sulfatase activity
VSFDLSEYVVRVLAHDGVTWRWASGCCIGVADDGRALVLTTKHQLFDDAAFVPQKILIISQGVETEAPGLRPEPWDPYDLVLLRVALPTLKIAKLSLDRLAHTPEYRAAGYAKAGRQDDGSTNLTDFGGTLRPGDAKKTVLVALEVTAPPLAKSWEGVSGSPVFVNEKLVAIITEVPSQFEGGRIDAIALHRIQHKTGTPLLAKLAAPKPFAIGVLTALPSAIGVVAAVAHVGMCLDRPLGTLSVDAVIAPDAPPEDAAPTPDAAPPRDGMVRIAGATFELGMPDPARFRSWCEGLSEPAGTCDQMLGRASELHGTMQVPTFDLDRFEVTRAQFVAWLEELLTRGNAVVSNGQLVRQKDGQLLADFRQCDPVVTLHRAQIKIEHGFDRDAAACMTFAAASDYCRNRGATLPTLAQWQLAAAGREHRLLPWGGTTVSCDDAVFGRDKFGPCAHEEQRAQSIDRVDRDVTPDGVHAMGGNVSEWVNYPADTVHAVVEHPAVGGSWVGGPADLSTANVRWLGAESLAATIGFRCAMMVW